ncbi:hypothetical protein BDV97DRAFT_50040 [Delphinella strobiligena]|nr:hypothetical protein BDV97DRAFT_50040 [Delphinella strobiligena]
MSSGLMDTEVGGENTQYESIKTVTNPSKKSGGQFEPETTLDASPTAERAKKAAEGEAKAEKIRYGQAISESGFGGMTTTSGGSGVSGVVGAGSVGGEGGAEETRKESGYEGDREMDTEIGA